MLVYLIMANLNPVQEHFLSKALEAKHALWNALLTVNGIILTAFSILPIVSKEVNANISLFLVACCFLSLLLVLWNFWVTDTFYRKVGQMVFSPQTQLTEENRKKNLKADNRHHRNVRIRQQVAVFLLVGETALICLLLFLASHPDRPTSTKSPPQHAP